MYVYPFQIFDYFAKFYCSTFIWKIILSVKLTKLLNARYRNRTLETSVLQKKT